MSLLCNMTLFCSKNQRKSSYIPFYQRIFHQQVTPKGFHLCCHFCVKDEGTSPHITFSGILLWNPYVVKLRNVLCTDLKVNNMLKEQPEEEFGPAINFREYSFLDNPLLPRHVSKHHGIHMKGSLFHYLELWGLISLLDACRWKSRGLMFSFVKKEPKIVVRQTRQVGQEYSDFQNAAMKTW